MLVHCMPKYDENLMFQTCLSVRFLTFDEQPIAAASIAQVHHGLLKNYQEVAVKVGIAK